MGALKRLAENATNLDIDDILKDIYSMRDFQVLVIKLNTQAQLFNQGIDSEGQSLGKYAPFTIEEKKKKGQPTDRITLKDTGEFYDSFRVKALNNGFVIIANTIKDDDDLIKDFGEDILGLTDLSISQVQLFLLDEIIPLVKEALFKGI